MKNVFKRVIAAVKYFAIRGYPFHGSDNIFGFSRNGAYLGVLELIAEYNPFFKHIATYEQKSRKHFISFPFHL